MKTVPLGPFLGINNRLLPFALHVDKQGDFLLAADNVDVDNSGRVRSRVCGERLVEMTGAHSLQMVSETAGYLVRSSVLYAITMPVYAETLVKILATDDDVRYLNVAGEWHYSNGTDMGRLENTTAYPIGIPTPVSPTATLISGGLLTGKYLVATSHCRKSASVLLEEGGISPFLSVERTTTGGFRVALPAAVAGATHINIYLSACNGSLSYLLATVAAGTATYDVVALPGGREANGRIEAPLLAGRLFEHNGRLCSFSGKDVCIGSPHRPGYFLPAEGRLHFPENVSIAISAQTGVFLAADKTYWIPGDLGNVQGQIVDVLPYGAVPGTEFTIPDSPDVGWFGAMGPVIANTQGQAVAVTNDQIDLSPPTSGFSTVLTSRGYQRVVSCGWCLNLENHAATQYSEWGFTSVSDGLGTKPDGIYLVDSDSPVDCNVGFGEQDFGTDALKHLPAVYASVSSETPMALSVSCADGRNDAEEYTYLARSFSDEVKAHRFDPGKGLRSGRFRLSMQNTDGSPFVLASISFAPTVSNRRI